jgi:5-methylcytosine-specific restriction endonuclease McrA
MGICTYCGSSWNTEDDHIKAKSKGGVSTTPACKACNTSKGSKGLMEWLRWVKKNDVYRWNRIERKNHNGKSEIAQKVHIVRDE